MNNNPVILIAGSEKSGKTSIIDVIFRRISAYKAFHKESTTNLERITVNNNALYHYDVCELPTHPSSVLKDSLHFSSSVMEQLSNIVSLIYVIDLDNPSVRADPFYIKCPLNMHDLLSELLSINKNLMVSILLHKTDSNIPTEQLSNIQRQIQQSLSDIYSSLDINIQTSYSRTCIYDYSISEAISKCLQRLMPKRSVLQNIINYFSQSCNIEKVYLFDTYCKLCLSQDSTPTDIGLYELCRDNIEVISDIKYIYDDKNTDNKYIYSLTKLERYHDSLGIYICTSIQNTAIVCILREDHYNKLGLIQYNLQQLNEAILNFSKLQNYS